MQAGFDGKLSVADGAAAAKGAVRIEAADLEPWLMTTGVSFPGMGMGTPVSLTAGVDFANGLLVVSDIQGEIADGPVGRQRQCRMKDGLPHLTGDLAIDAFDLEPVAAMMRRRPGIAGRGGQLAERAVPGEGRDAVYRRSRPDVRLGRRRASSASLEDAQMHATARQGRCAACPASAASSTAASSPACSRPGTMTARRSPRRSSNWQAPISARCWKAAD